MPMAVAAKQFQGMEDWLQGVRNLEEVMHPTRGTFVKGWRRILERWRAAAVKRVPVDNSTLKQNILIEWWWENGELFGACGTNVSYGVFVEFGNKWIAEGKVMALGTGMEITDAQAIHTWAAKQHDATDFTSASYHAISHEVRLLKNRDGLWISKDRRKKTDGGLVVTDDIRQAMKAPAGPQEQMPWLRTSFTEERDDMIDDLAEIIERAK